jgi:hypothetical protein
MARCGAHSKLCSFINISHKADGCCWDRSKKGMNKNYFLLTIQIYWQCYNIIVFFKGSKSTVSASKWCIRPSLLILFNRDLHRKQRSSRSHLTTDATATPTSLMKGMLICIFIYFDYIRNSLTCDYLYYFLCFLFFLGWMNELPPYTKLFAFISCIIFIGIWILCKNVCGMVTTVKTAA